MDARLAVLASGEGTNLQALLDDPVVGSAVRLVVSDRGPARALERARARGVPAVLLDPAEHEGRSAYDVALRDLLLAHDIGYVALAGFMRILGPGVVGAFAGRIVNVHPALLPSFPGAHGIRDAVDWGVKITGVTVHLVDEEMDHGPIVAQEAVAIGPDDDAASVEARIHEVEHRVYPAAVRALIEGRLKVDGRLVHVIGDEP